jgi:hypothetical protein
MTLIGHPDWHQPQRIGDRVLYAAYEQPKRFFLAPERLEVAPGPNADPDFRLDIFRQDRGEAGLENFALLAIRFSAAYEMAAAQQAVFDAMPDLQLRPVLPESGFLRFTAANALSLPDSLRAIQPLDVGAVGSLGVGVRLEGADIDVFLGSLRVGLATLWADAWLIARGVAPRFAAVVSFDPAALRSHLFKQASTDVLSCARLREALKELPSVLDISVRIAGDQVEAFAEALADRLIGRFGVLSAPPAGETGAFVRLEVAAMPSGSARMDLAEPVLVPRIFALMADPIGTARTLGPQFEDKLVRRIDAPSLQTGWRALSIAPNVPDRRVGALKLAVEILVKPNPPQRPQTVNATVTIEPGERLKSVALRLAPGEELAFDWQPTTYVTAGGGVERLAGAWHHHTREHLVIPPDVFPARLIQVEAEPSFLREASITVECAGQRNDRPWAVRGTIDAARPDLTIIAPHDVASLTLSAIARSNVHMPPVVATPLRLDPFSFEGSGARALQVECQFDDDAHEVLIECAPEDAAEQPARRRLLRLTPGEPRTTWTWLALSPFRSSYRWRWHRITGEPAIWSAVQLADVPLMLWSSHRRSQSTMEVGMETMVIDDITLATVPGEPLAFIYEPRSATVARDEAGRAQFSLIVAGQSAMFSCTTMWGVSGPALERVRGKLAARLKIADSATISLRHAPVEVGDVSLVLGDGSGSFAPFLSGRSSGAPPFHTVFNAMLTGDQRSAVEQAVAGKRGYLAVRYDVRPSAEARSSSAATSSSTSSRSFTFSRQGAASAGLATETVEESHETHSAAADGQPAQPRTIQSDAADWGLA